jgi:peptidyl-dipeptidase Dcp
MNNIFEPINNFNLPDFTKINPFDFPPALAAARAEHLKEILDIVNNKSIPTFKNTIEKLEFSGKNLEFIQNIMGILTLSCTNDELNLIDEQETVKSTKHSNDIIFNHELWKKVEFVYLNGKNGLEKELKSTNNTINQELLDESWRLVETTYKMFLKVGANLSEDKKEQLKAFNEEESRLGVKINQFIQKEKEKGIIFSADELTGLNYSLDRLEKVDDKYKLPMENTTVQSALSFLDKEETRKKLWEVSLSRNSTTSEYDTTGMIVELERIRAKKAELLGFNSHAAKVLDAQQTKTPERMMNLLLEVAQKSSQKSVNEMNEMGFTAINPWDRAQVERKFRETNFNLDEDELRKYFSWDNVLKKGLFYTAEVLYGLKFKKRDDVIGFHQDVESYEVFNEKNESIALFMVDPWERNGKFGGAWMMNLLNQSKSLNKKPVITNSLNMVKPGPGEQALLSMDEVNTAFHEFGHALHGILSNVYYPSLGGTNVATDFVELPSQIHEHWILHDEVVSNYAIHAETGEKLSPDTIEAIKRAQNFGCGYSYSELSQAALVDLTIHMRTANENAFTVDTLKGFEKETLNSFNLYDQNIPPRYSMNYFSHIWGTGYSASYGAYIASAVLDCDGFAWFKENGGFTRETGRHFEETILSRGNTKPPEELYIDFRGRNAEPSYFFQIKGLEQSPKLKLKFK